MGRFHLEILDFHFGILDFHFGILDFVLGILDFVLGILDFHQRDFAGYIRLFLGRFCMIVVRF